MEQQNLTTTEQKLQEELHVEQAVQDIVRLIKQDARTALLIVQLLRRYQLERSQVGTMPSKVLAKSTSKLSAIELMCIEQKLLKEVYNVFDYSECGLH